MQVKEYDKAKAIEYAKKWAYSETLSFMIMKIWVEIVQILHHNVFTQVQIP